MSNFIQIDKDDYVLRSAVIAVWRNVEDNGNLVIEVGELTDNLLYAGKDYEEHIYRELGIDRESHPIPPEPEAWKK